MGEHGQSLAEKISVAPRGGFHQCGLDLRKGPGNASRHSFGELISQVIIPNKVLQTLNPEPKP